MSDNRKLSDGWETWFTRSPGGEPRARVRDLTEHASLVLNKAVIGRRSEWTATVRLSLRSHDVTRDFELVPKQDGPEPTWSVMQAAAEAAAADWLRHLAEETAGALAALEATEESGADR